MTAHYAVPAMGATQAHGSRSDRYGFVPTSQLISGLQEHGWALSTANQVHSRTADKRSSAKHLLRFRRPDALADTPELIMINSHDGSSQYQLRVGYFRFACANGLIVGEDIFPGLHVRHDQHAMENVIEGTYRVLEDFPALVDRVGGLKAIQLSDTERWAFARRALPLRFDLLDEKTGAYPVIADQLLVPRRREDVGTDLWSTFNVIQENLIRGKLRGRLTNGQRRSTRPIRGIDQNVKINQALWSLAEEMRRLKA